MTRPFLIQEAEGMTVIGVNHAHSELSLSVPEHDKRANVRAYRACVGGDRDI